jgi:hypothetical protein
MADDGVSFEFQGIDDPNDVRYVLFHVITSLRIPGRISVTERSWRLRLLLTYSGASLRTERAGWKGGVVL